MLQAKSALVENADYILCDAIQLPDLSPKLGTLPNPDQSATLILMVDKLSVGEHKLRLSGPGIKNIEYLAINGLNLDWLSKRDDWNCSFPLGVDILLVDDKSVAALPRTTNVNVEVA
jgi:alpha-D-ribose 1-methylphosphonate 5-triphosphate synthase subunit PhnH